MSRGRIVGEVEPQATTVEDVLFRLFEIDRGMTAAAAATPA
jgi:hypothetical protein